MSTITIRLMGGLANQMFQYAAALALAQRRGAELVVNTSSYRSAPPDRQYLLHAFSIPERVDAAPSTADRLPKWLGTSPVGRGLLGRTIYREPHFHFDPAVLDLPAPCELRGYFHTPLYFDGYEALIRARFANLPPLSASAIRWADEIAAAGPCVAVHLRGGDYKLQSGAAPLRPLDAAYYERALAAMDRLAGNPLPRFVFTDDPDFARALLPPGGRVRLVETPKDAPWEDLHLMSQCSHMIMANSSFSWWGAWLNNAEQKIIIAPRSWFTKPALRSKNVCDVFPESWLLM
jgi:hypothetical protein